MKPHEKQRHGINELLKLADSFDAENRSDISTRLRAIAVNLPRPDLLENVQQMLTPEMRRKILEYRADNPKAKHSKIAQDLGIGRHHVGRAIREETERLINEAWGKRDD